VTVVVIFLLAGLSLSCGNSTTTKPSAPNHLAYVSLPGQGSVLLMQINGASGAITAGGKTPPVQNASFNGLALTPSRQFLYAVDTRHDTISIFSVTVDGTLFLTGAPVPAGNGADQAVVDPTGQYLLVTNETGSGSDQGDISVYSIAANTGVLTEVVGSPFPANESPTQILFTHSGEFVYVVNPGLGMVTAFAFCPPQRASQPQCAGATGVLSSVPGTPVFSGNGAAALAVDASDQFLYVVNTSAFNPPPYQSTIGNISAFAIDSSTGALSVVPGSPFTSTQGNGPAAIAVDPSGTFVYAASPGSSDSIWCFTITPTNGVLVEVPKSPFNLPAGGQFAMFDTTGGFFYIGTESGAAIEGYTYNPSTGVPSTISGSPFSTGTAPGQMILSE
jgi:6-phosphogluconolactonase (cycloisomerase 2 family)